MGRKLIKINDNTAIVVEPFKNDHGDYIGVREFYKPKSDMEGDWRPTQKGFSLPADDPEKLKKIRNAIKWAEENFEEEHKVLEAKNGKKKKNKDEDDDDDEPKSKKKSKKKSKRGDDDE